MDMEKVAVGIGAVIPAIQNPSLEYVDAWLAGNAQKAGTIKVPEQYPLYARPSIIFPTVAGTITTLLGVFGDKYIGKPASLGCLTYGVASLTGGLVNLAKAVSARVDAGVEAFFPNPQRVPTPQKIAQRTVSYVYPLATPQAQLQVTAPSPYMKPRTDTELEIALF